MGMVNNVWDDFKAWVDKDVEIVPPHEKMLVMHSQ
jgi:hypothetical protein